MIEAQDVSIAIGDRTIVHGLDFLARPGEITAIAGPNGSGKTTFFRALCGELPFTGSIRINDRDVAALGPAQAAMLRAVLPQAATLSFPFTVREVVWLGLSAGQHGDDPGQIVSQALERVDLGGFAGRLYQELSGGGQQRVQLARVLCQVWEPMIDGQPRYLLLDEPVSSLDIRHQLTIMDVARDFAARGGGVVAILHDLNLTAMYAARVHLINDGRLAAAGTPRAVFTDDTLEAVFGCRLRVDRQPPSPMPFVLPQAVVPARSFRASPPPGDVTRI